jgi:hypothetical protein
MKELANKRKAQLVKGQLKYQAKRTKAGWKRLWIHPLILGRVKELIAELEKYKN